MNKMFKKLDDAPLHPLPPGDHLQAFYARGRAEWDERVAGVVTNARQWRRCCFASFALAGVAIAGNVYQGSQSKVQPFVVVRDGLGDIVGARAVEKAEHPDPAYIAADLKRWVRDVRTVYTDTKALKATIMDAYAMTAKQSAAAEQLGVFYRDSDPFERAKKETVSVANQSALPVSDGDAEGRQTWRTEWTEITTARDGTVISRDQWQATITFRISLPATAAEVQNNPAGLYVVNYSWTKRGA